MSRIEESIEIEVPRIDVFRFCHDYSHRSEWDEQVDHIELLSPRPVRRGTLFRIDARFSGGAVFSWEGEYDAYQLPQGSTVRVLDTASSSPFGKGSELKWEFSSVGSNTRFTWIWDYKPHGFVASILDRLGRRNATQRSIKRSMANLKKLVESGRRASIK